MNNFYYPDNWPALAREIKQSVGYICQACNRQCRRPGEFWLGWQYTLTVAHWDHEYDAEAVFVVALCSRCHLLHDAPHSWRARRRHANRRRYLAGQLTFALPTS